jgi:hypothetical protein
VLYGFSSNVLYKSTNDGVTWALLYTFTGYSSVEQVRVLRSGTILALCRSGSIDASQYDFLRSTDNGATFTALASQPLSRTSPYSRLLNPHSICEVPDDGSAYAGDIFFGEYGSIGGSTNPAVRVFRSTDDGETFSVVTSFDPANAAGTSSGYGPMALDEIRHIHEVQSDPFVPGRIWITIGDNLTGVTLGQPRIGFSDDGGTTWTQVTRATKTVPASANMQYAQSRTVGLMFTDDAVYWVGDTPETGAYVWRCDRATHEIVSVAGPWPNTAQNITHSFTMRDGTYVMLTSLSVEPDVQANRDDMNRIVGSADHGATWVEMLSWRRIQTDQTTKSVWPFYTDPDANDEFWITQNAVEVAEGTGGYL